MKLRVHKHKRQQHMFFAQANRYWQSRIDEILKLTPEMLAARARQMAWAGELFKSIGMFTVVDSVQAVEDYVLHKVSNDDVVATFKDRADALALIQKHARQKKAKLYAKLGGEPVLFVEAEMA